MVILHFMVDKNLIVYSLMHKDFKSVGISKLSITIFELLA